jgi:hypothetical protein
MEKINCYKLLNLNVEDLIENYNIPCPAENKLFAVCRVDPAIFLKKHIHEKLSELGNLSSLVFHMKPYADKKNIHVDIDKLSKMPYWPSLNILIKGQGAMKWFSPATPGTLSYNLQGNVYYRYWKEHDYGDTIDEWTNGKVALVRTDIPHNAWNYSNEERLLISVRWSRRTSWEETLDWFDKNVST